nr:S46 family peptidase [Rhizobium mongolense]
MKASGRKYPPAYGFRASEPDFFAHPLGRVGTPQFSCFSVVQAPSRIDQHIAIDAPDAAIAAIRAKDYGPYVAPALGTLPVNYISTVDITNSNSGPATLNGRGEFVGLVFDGVLEGVISDWAAPSRTAPAAFMSIVASSSGPWTRSTARPGCSRKWECRPCRAPERVKDPGKRPAALWHFAVPGATAVHHIRSKLLC